MIPPIWYAGTMPQSPRSRRFARPTRRKRRSPLNMSRPSPRPWTACASCMTPAPAPEQVHKCRAQPASMMRQAQSALRLLLRMRAARERQEADTTLLHQGAWTEHYTGEWLTQALAESKPAAQVEPAAPQPDAAPVSPEPASPPESSPKPPSPAEFPPPRPDVIPVSRLRPPNDHRPGSHPPPSAPAPPRDVRVIAKNNVLPQKSKHRDSIVTA